MVYARVSPQMMRAAVFDPAAPHGVRLAEKPKPPLTAAAAPGVLCGRGAVVCEVKAAGVNPVDAKYIIGDKLPESWMGWASRRVCGSTPGFDFAGEVLAAPASSGFQAGDEVFGFAVDPAHLARGPHSLRGSLAEVVAAPLDQVARKPKELTFAEAAALPLVGTTALQACRQHGLREGQRVLVVGASGGVGHVAVQIAAAAGASVVGVCSGRNVDFVTGCGAAAVVDYSQDDCIARIAALGPYDLVLDCVSSADARDKAHSYLDRVRATGCVKAAEDGADAHNYVVFGGTTGQWVKAAVKRFTGLNLFKRGFEIFWIKMPFSAGVLSDLAAWAAEGKVKPTVNTVLPFTEAGVQQAFEALRGRRTAGKIVLDVGGAGVDDSKES